MEEPAKTGEPLTPTQPHAPTPDPSQPLTTTIGGSGLSHTRLSRAALSLTEGDLIIGADQRSAIGTLVERSTRAVRLLHLPRRDGDTLHHALQDRLGELPATLRRTLTWDQGTEMARHLTITGC